MHLQMEEFGANLDADCDDWGYIAGNKRVMSIDLTAKKTTLTGDTGFM